MKLTIEAKAILKALGHVQSVVERRNTIPILSNVLLSADKGEGLTLTTTDLDLSVSEVAPARVDDPGRLTVPAGLLFDIARKLPSGADVSLDMSGEDPRMVVAAGRSRFNLPVLPASDFPVMDAEGLDATVTVESAALRNLIDRTRFAISTEETRYYLNGLFLHPVTVDGEARLRSVATDGHRLALSDAPLAEAGGLPAVIVPRKTVGELRKLLDDAGETITLSASRSKIHADLGFARLTSKVIVGSFPDYVRVIPKDNPNRVRLDVELLAGAVDRVSTISAEKARSVKLHVKPGTVTLTVRNMEAGQAVDELEADYDGPDIEVGFNARYVLDVCAQLKGEGVEMQLADPASPVLVFNPSDANSRYVIMPLRV